MDRQTNVIKLGFWGRENCHYSQMISTDDIMLQVENPKESMDKLLESIQ